MVEAGSPTAGVDMRRDCALNKRRLCRHRSRDRAVRVAEIEQYARLVYVNLLVSQLCRS